MNPGTRVKVWNGDKSEYLGEGTYDGDVTVYLIHMTDGSIRSMSDASQKPTPDMLEGGRLIETSNPKMTLDSGRVVYGCQTWWGPVEKDEKRVARHINIFTIYDKPKDFPDKFVCRRNEAHGQPIPRTIMKEVIGTADTLEEIRKVVPEGLTHFPRDPSDDPVIVESWM